MFYIKFRFAEKLIEFSLLVFSLENVQKINLFLYDLVVDGFLHVIIWITAKLTEFRVKSFLSHKPKKLT